MLKIAILGQIRLKSIFVEREIRLHLDKDIVDEI